MSKRAESSRSLSSSSAAANAARGAAFDVAGSACVASRTAPCRVVVALATSTMPLATTVGWRFPQPR